MQPQQQAACEHENREHRTAKRPAEEGRKQQQQQRQCLVKKTTTSPESRVEVMTPAPAGTNE